MSNTELPNQSPKPESKTASAQQKQRSPNYPQMGFPQVLAMGRKIYDKNGVHPVPDQAIAIALDHTSLNGASKAKISALKKFGVLAPAGDQSKISPEAMTIFEMGEHDPEAMSLSKSLALRPVAFKALYELYGLKPPADAGIRLHLIKSGFTSEAADQLIKVYRETLNYVLNINAREGASVKIERSPVVDNEASKQNSVGASTEKQHSPVDSQPSSNNATSRDVQADKILRFQISADCEAEMRFSGVITQEGVLKLTKLLELSMDVFPTAQSLVEAEIRRTAKNESVNVSNPKLPDDASLFGALEDDEDDDFAG